MKKGNAANAVLHSLDHVQELEYVTFWHQQLVLQLSVEA